MRKRVFVLVLATVLCLSFMTTAAFAHHGSGGHHNQSCPYTEGTCPNQDCPYHQYSSGGQHHNQSCPYTQDTCPNQDCPYHQYSSGGQHNNQSCPYTQDTCPNQDCPYHYDGHHGSGGQHNQSCPYTQYTCTDQNCLYHHGGGVTDTHHTAHCGSHRVPINGSAVSFDTYAVKDANGYETNYIPLRDLACHLNGSSACFSVGWDGKTNTISVVSGESYEVIGSELKSPFSGDVDYQPSSSKLIINGKEVELEAILLKDSNGKGTTCYKLRDLGEALNFNVSWIPGTGIVINTDEPYSGAN